MNYDRLLTRIFDKKEKKMIYFGDKFDDGTKFIGIDPLLDCMLVSLDDIVVVKDFGDRYILMQCTGRKDKSQKLIYGGDIVTGYCSEPDGTDTIFTHGLVKYFDDSYDFGITQTDDYYGCELHEGRDLEIIGNRWENPELNPNPK